MQLTCRFYKNRLPETEDLVMVNVVNIEEMGVYVHLLEYNNIEGLFIQARYESSKVTIVIS